MIRYAVAAAGAFAALGTASLSAHHGWSGYDAATERRIVGAIERVVYTNPHVEIDVKSGDKTWNSVLAPPFRMEARGLPNGALKVGDTVTLIGYVHKVRDTELRAERIVVAGKTVELR